MLYKSTPGVYHIKLVSACASLDVAYISVSCKTNRPIDYAASHVA